MLELACQWRIFLLSGKVLYRSISRFFKRNGKAEKTLTFTAEQNRDQVGKETVDPAPRNEQVQIWMWLPGLIAVLCLTCITMRM
jgi:hypothetical protein